MLADLFYLSATWLVISFTVLLAAGRRVHSSDFLSSLLYLGLLVGIGDLIALWLFGEPPELLVLPSVIVFGVGFVLILLLRDWNAPGQVFFLISLTTVLIYLCYALVVTAFTPTSPAAYVFSFFLLLLETAALALSVTYAFEVLDVLCRVRWNRQPEPKPPGSYAPMVSLHVPAYNEPPVLVEETLRALAKLNYPNYEVILVDNNTPNETTWQPLAEVCRELGFKCLHLDKWPGYKSGALNFALSMTDPRAEIIGVIDADYIVQPDFLRRMVPYFDDPQVAFVQSPQDYRDHELNPFFQAAYDGYKYFFALSMPARNERNAIIFCGTMGLLRKSVLQEIGGWDEWCITEDAEASLRILNRGYKSVYVRESFGQGLMPMDFEGLKKQRFRWAFGGVQIIKKHWGKLMPWAGWVDHENRLTGAQRYFYLVSGLQWFNELLTFMFTVMVLISALLTVTGHLSFLRPVTEAFVILPIVLIGTNLLRALWGLRHALAISWKRAFLALTLWFGLTWVVALACVQALVRRRGVFLRTPKAISKAAWGRVVQATGWETLLGLTCLIAGTTAMILNPTLLTFGLMALCWTQSLIYLSAPYHGWLSQQGVDQLREMEPDRGEISGQVANEARLGFQIYLVALTLIMFVFASALLPASDGLPWWYSYFNPQPLIEPQAPKFKKPHPEHPNKPNKPNGPENNQLPGSYRAADAYPDPRSFYDGWPPAA